MTTPISEDFWKRTAQVYCDERDAALRECERLRSIVGDIPDKDMILRVAELADRGDSRGKYHYTATWLRSIAKKELKP